MRLGDDDKLRAETPGATPPERQGSPIPRGVYMKRVCLCTKCGSPSTVVRGAPKGRKYMHCLACQAEFKAANG